MRTKERIKNVLLCVLLVGMVYLAYSVWFFDSPFGDNAFGGFYDDGVRIESSEKGENADLERFGLRPLSYAVRKDGALGGMIYDSEKNDLAYQQLRTPIKKILSSAKTPARVQESDWKEALSADGLFFDYEGNVPFEMLKLFFGLSGSESNLCGRYFFFSTENKKVSVYIKNSSTEAVYLAETAYESQLLEEALTQIERPSLSFAFEREEKEFSVIRAETLVPDMNKRLQVLTAYNPAEALSEKLTDGLLDRFEISGAAPTNYSEQDGTSVYVADMVTLRISPSGLVAYRDTRTSTDEMLGIGVDADGEQPTLSEKAEAARALVASVAQLLPGNGGIYLAGIDEKAETTEFVFGRHLSGVPIDMNNTGYFARVVVKKAMISEASINLRTYNAATMTAEIMPVRLAAAALSGAGKEGELNVRYRDNETGTLNPEWFIGGMGKSGGKEDGQ